MVLRVQDSFTGAFGGHLSEVGCCRRRMERVSARGHFDGMFRAFLVETQDLGGRPIGWGWIFRSNAVPRDGILQPGLSSVLPGSGPLAVPREYRDDCPRGG